MRFRRGSHRPRLTHSTVGGHLLLAQSDTRYGHTSSSTTATLSYSAILLLVPNPTPLQVTIISIILAFLFVLIARPLLLGAHVGWHTAVCVTWPQRHKQHAQRTQLTSAAVACPGVVVFAVRPGNIEVVRKQLWSTITTPQETGHCFLLTDYFARPMLLVGNH